MEKDSLRASNNVDTNNTHKTGGDVLLKTVSETTSQTTSDFVLQWGNRKRLRCMKVQVRSDSSAPVHRTSVRVDRRVVRADKDPSNQPTTNGNYNTSNQSNGYLNLRQRPPSPQPPSSQRIPRYSTDPLI